MEKKNTITEQMRHELGRSFPKEAYKKHPTKTFLTTLKAMYVTERLNDVFGIGRWTIDIEIIERTADYVLMQGEFKSLDFDVIVPKQFGGHNTTGKNTEIADGFKSALTDCQSKIASYLEIGIEMFKGNIVAGQPQYKKPEVKKPTAKIDMDDTIRTSLKNAANQCNTIAAITHIWNANKELQREQFFIDLLTDRKKTLIDNGIDK